MAYTRQFINPHPDGWDDPSYTPPIDVNSMQAHTDAISGIDNYLVNNTGELLDITVTEDTTITVNSYGHTYIILTFGSTVPEVTFQKSDPNDPNNISYFHDEPPFFEANSVYELSFLKLYCVYKKR